MNYKKIYSPPAKVLLHDRGLEAVHELKGGNKLRVENDDWGKYLRVINKDNLIVYSELVVDFKNIDKYVECVKDMFN